MLSLNECTKILNKKSKKYKKEEIELIRDLLYKLAEIDKQKFQSRVNEKSRLIY
jgi:hypothetical protein